MSASAGVNLSINAEISAQARAAWQSYRGEVKKTSAMQEAKLDLTKAQSALTAARRMKILRDETRRQGREQKKHLDLVKSMRAKQAAGAMRALRGAVNSIGNSLLRIGKYTAVAFGAIAAKGIWDASKNASDYQETLSKFKTVYGESSDGLKKWSDENAAALGTTRQAMLGYLASTQDLLVPMGVASARAKEMSQTVAQLVPDLSSFNNLPTEQVIMDIQAALTGSGETMKKYGVVINETSIKQFAMATGIVDTNRKSKDYTRNIVALKFEIKRLGKIKAKSKEEWLHNQEAIERARKAISQYKAAMKPLKTQLTQQQKAQAILGMIMKGTTAAQGDAKKTANGHANILRRLGAAYTNISAKIGVYVNKAIDPMLKSITMWIKENEELIEQKIGDYIKNFGEWAASAYETIKEWAADGGMSEWFDSLEMGAYAVANGVMQSVAALKALIGFYLKHHRTIAGIARLYAGAKGFMVGAGALSFLGPAGIAVGGVGGYLLSSHFAGKAVDAPYQAAKESGLVNENTADEMMTSAALTSKKSSERLEQKAAEIEQRNFIRQYARQLANGDKDRMRELMDVGFEAQKQFWAETRDRQKTQKAIIHNMKRL